MLNEGALSDGGGVPGGPTNSNYENGIDALGFTETAAAIQEGYDAAKETAKRMCDPPECCKEIKITVECGDEFAAIEKKLGGDLCGKETTYSCKNESFQ